MNYSHTIKLTQKFDTKISSKLGITDQDDVAVMARIDPFVNDRGNVIDIVIMAKEKKGLSCSCAHSYYLTGKQYVYYLIEYSRYVQIVETREFYTGRCSITSLDVSAPRREPSLVVGLDSKNKFLKKYKLQILVHMN